MTEIFERGDRVWFENIRGLHVVVISDSEYETLFADTNGKIYEAEVGDDSLFFSGRGERFGERVERKQVRFE